VTNSSFGYSLELFGVQVNIVDDPLNNFDAGTYERIRFDPLCDCGEPVSMDTCYECQVVSSD